jgi:hypothetical protein
MVGMAFLPIADGEGDHRAAMVEGTAAQPTLARRHPSTALRAVPLPPLRAGRI